MIGVDCPEADCTVWVDVVHPNVNVSINRPVVQVGLPQCASIVSTGADEVHVGPGAPPLVGMELWVDTDEPDPTGTGASFSYSAEPPASPKAGDVWVKAPRYVWDGQEWREES